MKEYGDSKEVFILCGRIYDECVFRFFIRHAVIDTEFFGSFHSFIFELFMILGRFGKVFFICKSLDDEGTWPEQLTSSWNTGLFIELLAGKKEQISCFIDW